MEIKFFTVRQLNALGKDGYDELVMAFQKNDLTVVVADWLDGVDAEITDRWDEIALDWLNTDSYSVIKDGFSGRKNITCFEMYHDIRVTDGVETLRELYPEPDRERLVEMYVGYFSGSEGGYWELVDVYVPMLLPQETAVSLAKEKLVEMLADVLFVFHGVYCFWTDDMMLAIEEEE